MPPTQKVFNLQFVIIKYLTRTRRGEKLTALVQDAGSAVDQDTLLHLETLLVVAASNSEDVALELFTHDFSVDLLTHSSVVEGTATQQMAC